MSGLRIVITIAAVIVASWDFSLVLRRRRCSKCWRPFGIFTGKLCRRCWRVS